MGGCENIEKWEGKMWKNTERRERCENIKKRGNAKKWGKR